MEVHIQAAYWAVRHCPMCASTVGVCPVRGHSLKCHREHQLLSPPLIWVLYTVVIMSWVFSLCTHLMLMLTNLFTVSTSVSSICCPLFSQHGCPEKLHIHVQLADLNTNNTYCSYSSILPCAPSGSSTARQFLFIPLLAFLLQLSTAAKNFSQSKYASLNLLNTYPCFQKPLPALCSFSFTGLFPPLTPSSYRPLGAAIHIFYARPI